MTDILKPRRALISVSDKDGVVDLARALQSAGIEILSTGGTARLLREAGIAITDVAAATGFPEIMGGRIKTLHPRIHGGILARRGQDEAVMAEHQIQPIDLVVVNLYPFEATIQRPGVGRADAIEQIDIGGPAMLRAAAKNHADVAVVVEPHDYAAVAKAVAGGGIDRPTRERLAADAFAHTASYDAAIAGYLSGSLAKADWPRRLTHSWQHAQTLRYGENPHQRAALYRAAHAPGTLADARLVQGKPLSYNNLADADAALACVRDIEQTACVIVKHGNPCGVAQADSPGEAYDRAFATDPTSAFGGIIAFNRPLDGATAAVIIDRQFVEVIVTPGIADDAVAVLAAKPNVRVLSIEGGVSDTARAQLRSIDGGLLVQDEDSGQITADALEVVSRRQPDSRELADLLFAWRVGKHVRSNAIVLARDGRTVGIGAGQMSRVMSVRIAGWKRNELEHPGEAPVLSSDAFFPFRDGVDQAAAAGVTAIIQPGGSKRDPEVIEAADAHGLAMVLTGMRHFRH